LNRAAKRSAILIAGERDLALVEIVTRVHGTLRANSYPDPWKVLLPDLVMALTTPPEVRSY
jgi:hypothetical protein